VTGDVRYERGIAAPPEVVFDAFTNDGSRVAFYGEDDQGWIVGSESEVRVGGERTILFGPSREQLYVKVTYSPGSTDRDVSCSRPPKRVWTAPPCGPRPSSRSKPPPGDPDDDDPARSPNRSAAGRARPRRAERVRSNRAAHPRAIGNAPIRAHKSLALPSAS
jgi:hypothetical protein